MDDPPPTAGDSERSAGAARLRHLLRILLSAAPRLAVRGERRRARRARVRLHPGAAAVASPSLAARPGGVGAARRRPLAALPEIGAPPAARPPPRPTSTCPRTTMRSYAAAALVDAITVLPRPHRLALALHYVDDLTPEQIADTMRHLRGARRVPAGRSARVSPARRGGARPWLTGSTRRSRAALAQLGRTGEVERARATVSARARAARRRRRGACLVLAVGLSAAALGPAVARISGGRRSDCRRAGPHDDDRQRCGSSPRARCRRRWVRPSP